MVPVVRAGIPGDLHRLDIIHGEQDRHQGDPLRPAPAHSPTRSGIRERCGPGFRWVAGIVALSVDAATEQGHNGLHSPVETGLPQLERQRPGVVHGGRSEVHFRAGERPDRGRALHGARHRDQRRGRRPAVGGRHRQAAAPDAASGLRGGQRPDADNALQPAAGHELGSRGERIHGDRRPGTPRGELGVDFGDRCYPDPRPGRDVHR